MSRDSYVPHLFLRTSTESSSQGSAMQGAGTNPAAHVSTCLTPSGYLILLTSGSILPGADRLVPAPGRASAIPLPWCFSCAEWEQGTYGFLLRACCASGILGVSACCALSVSFLTGLHLRSYRKSWHVPKDSCQEAMHHCFWGWR